MAIFIILNISAILWTTSVLAQETVFGVSGFKEYEAFLSPEQELGEPNGSSAQGYGRLSFADNLSKAQVEIFIKNVDVSQMTAFHIHCGSPNVLGPMIVDFSMLGAFTDTIVNNHLSATIANEHIVFVTTPPPPPTPGEPFTLPLPEGCPDDYGQLSQVYTIAGLEGLAKKGLLYFNLHTAQNEFFGEIRGQLYPMTQYKSVPTVNNLSFGEDSFTHYTAHLSPEQELGPANGSQASGLGTIRFAHNLSFAQLELNIEGVEVDQIAALHLHCGSPNVLGPYIINFADFGDFKDLIIDGKMSVRLTNANIVFVTHPPHPPALDHSFTLPLPEGCPGDIGQPGQVYTIAGLEALARKGLLYFNVHSIKNQFYGEIRGKLDSDPPRTTRATYENNQLRIPYVDLLDENGKTMSYQADLMRVDPSAWLFELKSAEQR